MTRFSALLAIVISLSLACGSCRKEANELAHNHSHGHHDHEADDHESHDHDDDHDSHDAEPEGVITLHPEVAERFGLKTKKAVPRMMFSGVTVGGSVELSDQSVAVVSAPIPGVVSLASGVTVGAEVNRGAIVATVKPGMIAGGDAMRMAKVDLDAAQAEYDRVASLYADRLVTVAEYNAARASLERAKAAYSAPASSGQATVAQGGVITAINVRSGETVEAGQPLMTVASGSQLAVTALMPVSDYQRLGMPVDARVKVPYANTTILLSEDGGKLKSTANAIAAASGGYVPVTFTLTGTAGLVPGSAVEIYLMGDSGREVLSVPREALVEQQGTYSVFTRLDEDCYLQVPVTVGASDGEYIEIISGISEGDDVVTEGVTAVRLAATSGNVPEGHSHSH